MTESDVARKPGRRRLWLILGALAGLLVLALVLLPFLVDIETFREPIQQAIESATGWEVELGEMDLAVWSGVALTVSPARLSAPGDGSSIQIGTISIKASLLPLLSGRLEVQDVDLVDPSVRLVRESVSDGWILPVGEPAAEDVAATPAAAAGSVADADPSAGPDASRQESAGLAIEVERIRLRRGSLRIEDRATEPPLELELENVNAVILPALREVSGSGDLAGDRGSIAWKGSLERGIALELAGLPTELLHAFIGSDLVHAGGRLSGTIDVAMPLAIAGKLRGEGVTLLSGERPFNEPLEIDFGISTEAERWTLDRVEVLADGVRMTGRGELLPAIDLDLEIPDATLAAVLDATAAILPLPLDLEPPGQVRAAVNVRQPAGGLLTYEAAGALDAAGFKIDDMLPVARDVRTEFSLDRAGLLEVRILDGRVGGGPLRGTARIDPIYPPGTLTFDGGLQDAVLGQLLGGLVVDAEKKISGPTGLEAAMGIDLGRETFDARAIAGTLRFDSRQVSLPGWDLEGAIRQRLEEKLGTLGQLASLLDGKERTTTERAAERLEEVFESVEASVDFDSWPWKLERLAIAGGHFTANGGGTFDPERGEVDIDVSARLDKKRTRQLVEEHSELRVLVDREGRLTLPIEIRGALTGPSIKADLGKVAEEQLGEKPEEAIKGLLRGLLDKKKD